MPYLQVVLPTNTAAPGSQPRTVVTTIFDTTGAFETVQVTLPIPEPTTLVMAGMGLIGLVAIRRRK